MFRIGPFVAAMIFLALIGYIASQPALNESTLEQTHKAILAQKFSCPENSKEEIIQWYLDGYVRRCVDNGNRRTGPMMGWRDARLVVTGNYHQDSRDGEWVWYRADGTVEKRENYRRGARQ